MKKLLKAIIIIGLIGYIGHIEYTDLKDMEKIDNQNKQEAIKEMEFQCYTGRLPIEYCKGY